MATRELKELPAFILEELAKFHKEPRYQTASEFTVFNDKGVEVTVCFQRDNREKINTTPLFKKKLS